MQRVFTVARKSPASRCSPFLRTDDPTTENLVLVPDCDLGAALVSAGRLSFCAPYRRYVQVTANPGYTHEQRGRRQWIWESAGWLGLAVFSVVLIGVFVDYDFDSTKGTPETPFVRNRTSLSSSSLGSATASEKTRLQEVGSNGTYRAGLSLQLGEGPVARY
jgi:hypothetical protein